MALAPMILPPSTPGAEAAGRHTDGDGRPWSVAILDFEGLDVPHKIARAAAESLGACLQRTGEFAVVNSRDVRAAVQQVVGGREPTGEPVAVSDTGLVCGEASCAIAAGERLRANTVITGTVSELGRMLSVSIRAYNVHTGEVSGEWKAESFEGREDLAAIARNLVDQVVEVKPALERGGRALPEAILAEQAAALAKLSASFTFGGGLGLAGASDSKAECINVTDTSRVCTEHTADVKWLVSIALYGTSRDSRLVFGLRGGGMYTETTMTVEYRDPTGRFPEASEDNGFRFYLYPLLGYMLAESGGNNVLAFGGAGYRNFTDDSGVSTAFAALGLTAQVSKLNAEIVYWRGFDSDKLLRNLVTAAIGFGTGF